ncbi:MAG: DUF167 domain-containing protein [Anaerolineaceae bacterium]|nr:DUF167 domain-containing protein [Anaerolineaceae bacterium]
MKRLFRKFNLHEGKRGSAVTVHVVPGSSGKRISNVMEDGTLVVEMDTRDVSGKTNQAIVKFFSGILNVSVDEIEVVAGKDGADKLISIINENTTDLHEKLMALVEK